MLLEVKDKGEVDFIYPTSRTHSISYRLLNTFSNHGYSDLVNDRFEVRLSPIKQIEIWTDIHLNMSGVRVTS